MSKKLTPFAICYDFDGTLAPGNMQERDFIPDIGMESDAFWEEVKSRCKEHEADQILMYMWLMLEKAEAAHVPVRRSDIVKYGRSLKLFPGVTEWFKRINEFGRSSGFTVSHHIISSGLREVITGTKISKYFKNIYASGFCYDHNGVAKWPALALNYTTKTQYLFRINKGAEHVYDDSVINEFVPHEDRPIPFTNIIYIGDGATDVPCFRLVKEQGGHSIAVYKTNTKNAKSKPQQLLTDGRVDSIAPANYEDGRKLDWAIKAIMEAIAAQDHLRRALASKV